MIRSSFLPLCFLGLLALGTSGCAATTPPADDGVTVRGRAYVAGNAPFTGLLLETPARNLYVLALDPPEEARLRAATPVEIEAVGVVSQGDWMGRPTAVLTVRRWQTVEDGE